MRYNQVSISIPLEIAERESFYGEEAQDRLAKLACSIVGHKIRRYDWDVVPWITCERCGLDFGEAPDLMDKIHILSKPMLETVMDSILQPSPFLTFLKKRLN